MTPDILTNPNASLLPSHARLVRDVFGQVGWQQVKDILKGNAEMQQLPTRPTSHYLHSLYGERKPDGFLGSLRKLFLDASEKLHIEHRYFDHEFREDYLNAQSDVNAVFNVIINNLGLPNTVYGLREGVTATTDNVQSNLRKLFMSGDDINIVYQHQILIQQLLTVVSLELNKSHRAKQMRNELSSFVDWAEQDLFISPGKKLGDTEKLTVYSVHKKGTNWTTPKMNRINSPFSKEEIKDGIMKRTELAVRTCELGGRTFKVMFDTRKKSDATALIKALAKAINRRKKHNGSDEVVILDDVIDIIGTKIVVVEGNKNEFVRLFEEKLKAKYGDVVDDSVTDEGRGQSKRHTFARKVVANGIGTEVIVYSLQEYLNSEYDIGILDETGKYNGASHAIYDLVRMAEVARILFPKEIHPDLDIEFYLKSALWRAVQRLKRLNNVKAV